MGNKSTEICPNNIYTFCSVLVDVIDAVVACCFVIIAIAIAIVFAEIKTICSAKTRHMTI